MIKIFTLIVLSLLLLSCATTNKSSRVSTPGFEENRVHKKSKTRSYGVDLGVEEAEKNIKGYGIADTGPLIIGEETPAFDLGEILRLEISAQRYPDKTEAVVGMLKYAETYKDPKIAQRAYDLSVFLYDSDISRETAKLWYEIDPQSPAAQTSYIKELITNSNYKLAFELMAQRIEQGRASDFRPIANFYQLLDEEQARDLIRTYIRYMNIYPEAKNNLRAGLDIAYYRLAHFLFYQEQNDKSLQLLNLIIDSNTSGNNESLMQQVIELKGRIYYLTKRSNGEPFYVKSIRDNPESYPLQIYYALYLIAQQEAEKAEKMLIQMLEKKLIPAKDTNTILFLAMGAQKQSMANLLRKSLTYLQNLPDQDESSFRMGMVALAGRNEVLAEEFLSRVSTSSDFSYNALWLRLKNSINTRDFSAGEALLEEVLSYSRREYVFLTGRYANELGKRSYVKEAGAIMKTANDRIPFDEDLIQSSAFMYYETDQISAMKRQFDKAMTVSGESDAVKNSYGYSLTDKNIQLDKAKELIDDAIEANPISPAYVDSLGWWYFRKGELQKAEDLLQWAYRQKQDAEIAAHLGEVSWSQNKIQRAKYIWLTAYEQDSNSNVLQKIMDSHGINWRGLNPDSGFFNSDL